MPGGKLLGTLLFKSCGTAYPAIGGPLVGDVMTLAGSAVASITFALRARQSAEGKLYQLPYILLFSILAIVTGANSYRSRIRRCTDHKASPTWISATSWSTTGRPRAAHPRNRQLIHIFLLLSRYLDGAGVRSPMADGGRR